MKPSPLKPGDVLKTLVTSELAVLRSRNPELSAVLDVSPPGAKDDRRVDLRAVLGRGLYAGARRAYRFLDQFAPLRPLLHQLRSAMKGPNNQVERSSVAATPVHPEASNVPRALKALVPSHLSRSYTIAFTMRSGSNEICNLLARNGLGMPNEFFQNPLSTDGDELLLNSFGRMVSRYQKEGVFGSKMSHDHRAALDEQLRRALPDYRRLDDVLPAHRWVWLKRQDKILQAISWCRAETSHQWAKTAPARSSEELTYDFFHILSRIMLIYTNELSWEMYFHEQNITPCIVIYEDFFSDVNKRLSGLIEYLGGLPAGHESVDTGITYAVQRNESTYILRRRFVSDLCRMGEKGIVSELGEPLHRWMQFFLQYGWRG